MPDDIQLPSKRQLFLTGCFGAAVLFAVFYLRHLDVFMTFLNQNVGKYGAIVLLPTTVALLVLWGAAGAWALFSEARSLKAAFTTGLGAPALFFAADVIPVSGGDNASLMEPMADVVLAGAIPLRSGSWLSEALRPVFAPVTVVREIEGEGAGEQLRAVREENRRLHASLDSAEAQTRSLGEGLRTKSEELSRLEANVATLREEQTTLNASLARLTERERTLTRERDTLRTARDAAVQTARQETERADRLKTDLTRERSRVADLQRRLEAIQPPILH